MRAVQFRDVFSGESTQLTELNKHTKAGRPLCSCTEQCSDCLFLELKCLVIFFSVIVSHHASMWKKRTSCSQRLEHRVWVQRADRQVKSNVWLKSNLQSGWIRGQHQGRCANKQTNKSKFTPQVIQETQGEKNPLRGARGLKYTRREQMIGQTQVQQVSVGVKGGGTLDGGGRNTRRGWGFKINGLNNWTQKNTRNRNTEHNKRLRRETQSTD